MKFVSAFLCALVFASSLAVTASAGDKKTGDKDWSILDYEAQKKAPKGVKRIVFIADKRPHGPRGNHEFVPGAVFLARTLNAQYPNVHAVVYPHNKMPKDLSHADLVVVLLNHGGMAADSPAVKAAMERGAGFMAIHYGVEVSKGKQGEAFLDWMGGYFEAFWSVNPFWTPTFMDLPKHEVTRGVKGFSVNDEWYYHMRFVKDMKGVTPILSAIPKVETVRFDGKKASSHGGNADVLAEVKAGKAQHLAWAYERPKGGRGFGFTGYHRFDNLKDDNFRKLLLNAVAWTGGLEVPADGIPSPTLTAKDLDQLYQDGLRVGE